MSPEGTSTQGVSDPERSPITSGPAASGRGPSVPLETEPLVCFHPLLAGRGTRGTVQPVSGTLGLEEEPATWPELRCAPCGLL